MTRKLLAGKLRNVTQDTQPDGAEGSDAPAYPSQRIDPSKPSLARVYDCFLGGKDNYAVDRAVFHRIIDIAPQMASLVAAERAWLGRVTRFLVDSAGIEQLLDLGTGLPTAENTHEAAQRRNKEARVIYVEKDPVVLAHGRAFLEENDRTHLIEADLSRPDEVFGHATVRKHLDPTQPVALIVNSTLHHIPDELRPLEIMQRYIEPLPSGSYVVLSHFCDPQDGGEATRLARFVEDIFVNGPIGSGFFRTRDVIESYFCGLELLPPGIVRLRDWWPDGPNPRARSVEDELLIGGVAKR
jgi:S-adenosyl methyltransferase